MHNTIGIVTRSHFSKWMRDKRTPKDVCGEASGGVPKYRLFFQAGWAQVDKYQFDREFREY